MVMAQVYTPTWNHVAMVFYKHHKMPTCKKSFSPKTTITTITEQALMHENYTTDFFRCNKTSYVQSMLTKKTQ